MVIINLLLRMMLVIALIFIFPMNNTYCLYFGIAPQLIKLETFPGGVKNFKITIGNMDTSKEMEYFKIYVNALKFNENGDLDFVNPDTEGTIYSCADWIKINVSRIALKPYEEEEIECRLIVPQGISGGGWYAAIICEPITEEEWLEDDSEKKTIKGGSVTRWRMASIIELTLHGPGIKEDAEIQQINVEPQKEGWQVDVMFKNKGNIHVDANGYAIVKDKDNRIAGRIQLKSSLDGASVLPEEVCRFYGMLRKTLKKGTYTVQVCMYYGNAKKYVTHDEIFVSDGIVSNLKCENIDTQRMVFCVTRPEVINLELLPGRFVSKILTVKNIRDEEIYVDACIKDFDIDYKDGKIRYLSSGDTVFSASGWLKIAPCKFKLNAGEEKRIKLMLSVPKDVAGGYYTAVMFNTSNKDNMQAYTATPLIISIKDTLNVDVKVTKFDVRCEEEKDMRVVKFFIELENNGNVHVNSKGELIIKNDAYDEVGRLLLEDTFLLPGGKSQIQLSLVPDETIKKGEYMAELIVDYGVEKQIKKTKKFQMSEYKQPPGLEVKIKDEKKQEEDTKIATTNLEFDNVSSLHISEEDIKVISELLESE